MLPQYLLSTLVLVPLALAQQPFSYQGFFPINSPTSQINWVRGRVNTLSWDIGWDAFTAQLPPSFDVVLQDPMTESRAIRIATRVPLEAKKLAISLGDVVPLSSTWYLTFSASYSGQIFATSEKFTITDSGTAVSPGGSYPTITVDHLTPNNDFIATLTGKGLPTQTTLINDKPVLINIGSAGSGFNARAVLAGAVALTVGAVVGGGQVAGLL